MVAKHNALVYFIERCRLAGRNNHYAKATIMRLRTGSNNPYGLIGKAKIYRTKVTVGAQVSSLLAGVTV